MNYWEKIRWRSKRWRYYPIWRYRHKWSFGQPPKHKSFPFVKARRPWSEDSCKPNSKTKIGRKQGREQFWYKRKQKEQWQVESHNDPTEMSTAWWWPTTMEPGRVRHPSTWRTGLIATCIMYVYVCFTLEPMRAQASWRSLTSMLSRFMAFSMLTNASVATLSIKYGSCNEQEQPTKLFFWAEHTAK